MIKAFLFCFLLIVSGICQANVRMELVFPEDHVKQGGLLDATLRIDMESAQNFEIQKLKKVTAGDTLYFHELSPLLRSGAGESLTSEVSVIFLKLPERNSLQFKIGEQSINLSWNDIQVSPTNVGQKFIFENFSIPDRKNIKFWILFSLGIAALAIIGIRIARKIKISRIEKSRLQKLKEDILDIDTYEGVIHFWKNKVLYIKEFPHLEFPLKNLEQTLFKYVFKPAPNDQEKTEVIQAYRKFVNEIREGFGGI